MKRVVTGHDAHGKAVFVSTGEPVHRVDVTALGWRELWTTFPEDALPVPDPAAEPSRDARWTSVYPRPGQSMFRIIEFRPGDAAAKGDGPLWDADELAIMERECPGTLDALEPDAPGMHTTDSVDYGIVLEGRIGLELDDGAIVELEPGDVVVQNGTRHAWRPRERTRMAFVMIGVARREEQ
jgi:mannose-6-phosphate isomerase-like protein (cupin superfamily)